MGHREQLVLEVKHFLDFQKEGVFAGVCFFEEKKEKKKLIGELKLFLETHGPHFYWVREQLTSQDKEYLELVAQIQVEKRFHIKNREKGDPIEAEMKRIEQMKGPNK